MPALCAWTAAWVATGQGPQPLAIATLALVALSTVVLLAVAGRRAVVARVAGRGAGGGAPAGRRRGRVALPLRVLPAFGLAMAAALAVTAATWQQVTGRATGPVPTWAREHAMAQLEGQVVTDPALVRSGRFPGPARVVLRVDVDTVTARGQHVRTAVPVLVLAPQGDGPGSWGTVTAGRRVRFAGRLAPTEQGDDIVAVVSASAPPSRIVAGGWYWRAADRVRAGLREACRGLGADAAGLLPSLVVGDTSALPSRLRDDLRRAGLTHLTAVSGANVAIVTGAVMWVAAALGARRRLRLFVAAVAIAGFVVLARPSPSVLRAATMGTIALAGVASGGRRGGLPILATAVTGLLAVDPWLSRSPGFALSVAATSGLLLLTPPWARLLERRMPRPCALALAAPAAAQAACGPVLVLLEPSLCLVSVPANLLAEPAVAPATVLGVVAALASLVWLPAAHLIAVAGGLATGWIAQVAHRAAALPMANIGWWGGVTGALLLAVLTSVVAWWSLTRCPAGDAAEDVDAGSTTAARRQVPAAGRRRRAGAPGDSPLRRSQRRLPLLAFAVLLAAVLGWVLAPRLGLFPGGGSIRADWQVALCDVGQGEALVVRTGRDRAVLVDAGPRPEPVDRCLSRLGVRELDMVVLTHVHADHVSGLPGAMAGRHVAAVLTTPLAEPVANAVALRVWAASAGIPVTTATAPATGWSGREGWHLRWRVLAPDRPPAPTGQGDAEDGTAVNEASLVLLLESSGPAGALRLLALGDLETAGQQRLAERIRSGQVVLGSPVDAVNVAHHGSARQWGDLYRLVAAPVALIGVGVDNDYGHPAPRTLALLRSLGMRVFRTDTDATVIVNRDHEQVTVGSYP